MSRVVTAACLLAMGILVLASVGVCAEDSDFYEIGDRWVYDVSIDVYMDADLLAMEGTVTYRMDAISTASVAGVTYDVYEIHHDADLTISGDIGGVTVDGSTTITGKDSIEVDTLETIRSEQNMSMDMELEYLISISVESWEYKVETYSPPGGVGDEPDEMTDGTSWTITYTTHWESKSYDSFSEEIETDSGSSTEVWTYTYIGMETTTVPAGTFECEVVQIDDGDSIRTEWYSDEVGHHVKSVYESGSDQTGEMVLTSYSFEASDSEDNDTTLYLILGAVVAVIVVVAVVAVLMLRKKPGAPQMMPGQPPISPASTEQAPPVQPPPAGPPPEGPSQ